MAARVYPVGTEMVSATEAHVRVWAPDHASLTLVIDGRTVTLDAGPDGYHAAQVVARPGSRYGFRFEGDGTIYPDPASRSQPDGPDGLSAIVDLRAHAWQDAAWKGVSLPGQVLYELHVGTFTPEGTWRAAEAHLARLRDVGVTVIQMMPVAEFAGSFGWGYDGVQWFAPFHGYGTPADLQHFVDAAHGLGLAVTLDVVYNHLGPSGNYLPKFSGWYTSRKYANEWGEALNFDDAHCEGMRELVLSNVAYWVREFHVDGFRIDAAQQIFDVSPEHILAALTRVARETAAPRSVIVVAEHEPQHARLMRPVAAGGYGMDGVFNEDLHHTARVALTGTHEAYTSDYRGTAREWLSAALHGFLFQGQYYPWQSQPPRRACPRSAGACIHRLPREPRPGRQCRGRQAAGGSHQPAGMAGNVGAAAPRAVDATALPGAGVGRPGAVQLLLRPCARSAGRRVPGPPGVPQSVHPAARDLYGRHHRRDRTAGLRSVPARPRLRSAGRSGVADVSGSRQRCAGRTPRSASRRSASPARRSTSTRCCCATSAAPHTRTGW